MMHSTHSTHQQSSGGMADKKRQAPALLFVEEVIRRSLSIVVGGFFGRALGLPEAFDVLCGCVVDVGEPLPVVLQVRAGG